MRRYVFCTVIALLILSFFSMTTQSVSAMDNKFTLMYRELSASVLGLTPAAPDPGSPYNKITLESVAEGGGKIVPAGKIEVTSGGLMTFTMSPDKGFELVRVEVDGFPVRTLSNSWTFTNVNRPHKIVAVFENKGAREVTKLMESVFGSLTISKKEAEDAQKAVAKIDPKKEYHVAAKQGEAGSLFNGVWYVESLIQCGIVKRIIKGNTKWVVWDGVFYDNGNKFDKCVISDTRIDLSTKLPTNQEMTMSITLVSENEAVIVTNMFESPDGRYCAGHSEGRAVKISNLYKDSCSKCNGTGQIVCPHCKGNPNNLPNCDKCDGRGVIGAGNTISCPKCGGTGNVKCVFCEGAGKVPCPYCQ